MKGERCIVKSFVKRKIIIPTLLLIAIFYCTASFTVQASEAYQTGDTGAEISNIQSKLNFLGFDCGIVDGFFGKNTFEAVKSFQLSRGLETTGSVDAATYKALIERDMPQISRGASHVLARRIIQTAMKYIGVPYVFGGTTPSGFDCSGFIGFVFGQAGIKLPRTADAQYETGTPVSASNLQPGDLVFFSTYLPGASHSGIYLGNGRFISATSSSGIKINNMSDYYWAARYFGACKII